MTQAQVAAKLGITRARVAQLERKALAKLRLRPLRLLGFRAAVAEQRHALDARTPNRPWTDIDAQPEFGDWRDRRAYVRRWMRLHRRQRNRQSAIANRQSKGAR